ncbi:MAG: cytochrome b/b6 domain-containing protein [Gammaproteobacteria bacterium]|nr:cytochrome b/b6 domain-containing protein [Gammaproteobacteria bacterium]
MNRYHPILVALHWLIAIMIFIGLFMGSNVLSETANTEPQKLFYLKMHMSAGLLILLLMTIRLGVRLFTSKPGTIDMGNGILNKLGVITHYLFYLVVILMAGSGLAIANMAGLPEIVFSGSGVPLPETFDEYPPRIAHGVLGFMLLILIIGHVSAFAYHQFFRKDSIFSRMWFGHRS